MAHRYLEQLTGTLRGCSDEDLPWSCAREVTPVCKLGSGDHNEPIQVIEEGSLRVGTLRFRAGGLLPHQLPSRC